MQEKIAHRIKNHPLEHPNIGSIFKNISLASVYPAASSKYQAALASQSLVFPRFGVFREDRSVPGDLIGEADLRIRIARRELWRCYDLRETSELYRERAWRERR